jgi:hypothetical protein
VRIVLLTNNAEKVISMLEKNFGGSNKIIDQLQEARLQKTVRTSKDFQRFSNLVENLAVTVDNIGRHGGFQSNAVINELLKKLPEYLRLQCGQYLIQNRIADVHILVFTAWVSEQNDVIATVEIGNESLGRTDPLEIGRAARSTTANNRAFVPQDRFKKADARDERTIENRQPTKNNREATLANMN